MIRATTTAIFLAAILGGAAFLITPQSQADTADVTPPKIQPAREPSATAGRYLVRVSGCNDCHTPGFMQMGEAVPESAWLTGVPVGWRGPWGTTYASNLRLFIKPFSEDDFIKVARTRNTRPPMPWPSLHAMSDSDLRSVYRYIKSLGEAGEATPSFVPPDQEPKTPYLNLMPVMPKAVAAKNAGTSEAAAR